MLQVTGVVAGDAQRDRVPRGARLEFGQHLRDVAALAGQRPRARRVRRVVPQQASVLLERRPAAGRVDGDRVHVGQRRLEGVDEAPGHRLGVLLQARVHHQRAAAALRPRDHHVAALGREHAGRGGIDAGEEDPLHAAEQQGHPAPPRALRRDHLRQRRPDAAERDARRHRLHGAQARRKQVQQSGPAHEPLEPQPLIGPQLQRHPAQPAGIGEQREDQAPEQPVARRARHVPFDLRPGRLHQLVVLHARRARRHARHAAEAGVEVARELRGDLRLAFPGHLQQVNPSPRRVGLAAPQGVGRARREAEPAVHAVGEQIGRRRAVRVESAGGREHKRLWYRTIRRASASGIMLAPPEADVAPVADGRPPLRVKPVSCWRPPWRTRRLTARRCR